jgi:kynurenine formamidase
VHAATDPSPPPPASDVLRAAALVRRGQIYALARARFPGMPGSKAHPAFQVLSYRTPSGLSVGGDTPWKANDVGFSFINELMIATSHSGAHIDALAHVTLATPEGDHRWNNGRASADLGDFGPQRGDASELAPIWRRGVLFDVAAFRGVEYLEGGDPITASELGEIEAAQGVAIETGDVALIRTGAMLHWPDPERAAKASAGPDLSAARWLVERGVYATGSDTYAYEVVPPPAAPGPTHPMPVHSFLLIDFGVYIMEFLDLEELARDRVYEFLFVALPLKIKGATGSMIDPVAVA